MRYYLLNFFLGRVAAAATIDLLCLALAAALTWFMAAPPFEPLSYAAGTVFVAGLAFVLLYYSDAYSIGVVGNGRRTLSSIVCALGIGTGTLLLVNLFFRIPSPAVLATAAHAGGLYFPLLLVGRSAFRAAASRTPISRRILIVGTSDLGRAIAEVLHERSDLGAEVVGFLSDDPDDVGRWIEQKPVLGPVNELEKVLDREEIGRIVMASKRRDEQFPADELLAAKVQGVCVESGVAFYERITGRIYLRELKPSFLIFEPGFRVGRASEITKRILDLVLASVGLLLSAPLMAIAALALRLDSSGPVFYAQQRIGRLGRPIVVRKLRSMHLNAERDTGPVWTTDEDHRVTRVGRILRKTRLDEMPQLWSVLRGDMSLVGPRPERPEFVETLTARYPYFRLRTAVRPGLTGWAQIRHGYVNDVSGFEDKLALDLYYMKHRSLTMDLLVLWNTLKTVVLLRGQ